MCSGDGELGLRGGMWVKEEERYKTVPQCEGCQHKKRDRCDIIKEPWYWWEKSIGKVCTARVEEE